MPDADRHPGHASTGRAPSGWGDAFAALPLETPPQSRWQRIAAALPTTRPQRMRRMAAIGLAAAAVLAVVALMPRRTIEPPADAPSTIASRSESATTQPQPAPEAVATTAPVASDAGMNPRDAIPDVDEAARRDDIPGTSQIAAATPEPDADAVTTNDRPALMAAVESASVAPHTASVAPDTASAPHDLDRLQAESAQLESLLALARDDAVSSGAVAAVAAELTDQVELIDAALIQPSLPAAQRTELWQDRVDALRQLAGFESTQRLLAARGERQDTLLVSVD